CFVCSITISLSSPSHSHVFWAPTLALYHFDIFSPRHTLTLVLIMLTLFRTLNTKCVVNTSTLHGHAYVYGYDLTLGSKSTPCGGEVLISLCSSLSLSVEWLLTPKEGESNQSV